MSEHQPPSPKSVKLYRTLIQLYPPDYQKEYGPLALQLFSDIHRDISTLSTTQRTLVLARVFGDTCSSITREQLEVLKRHLNVKDHNMTKSKKSYFLRHRTGLIVSGIAIVSLSVASIFLGFWTYSGPAGYLERVISQGARDEKIAGSTNVGWDDVTAHFVNDYVQAHYYGDKRTDVGLKSSHAYSVTYMVNGKDRTFDLSSDLNEKYAQKDSSFDDITCSTQAPVAVRYLHEPEDGHGDARMIAQFYYAGQTEPNVVEYNLTLDQTKSVQGDWKVSNISCLSLEFQASKPYITDIDAIRAQNTALLNKIGGVGNTANQPSYDQRNDRAFGPAAR